MRKLLFLLLFTVMASAQNPYPMPYGGKTNVLYPFTGTKIGINTATPAGALDIVSTSQGFLLPRMNTSQKNAIVSPAISTMVFDTTLGKYSYYDGSVWVSVLSGNDSNWILSGQDISNNNTGNVNIKLGNTEIFQILDLFGTQKARIDHSGYANFVNVTSSIFSGGGGGLPSLQSTSTGVPYGKWKISPTYYDAAYTPSTEPERLIMYKELTASTSALDVSEIMYDDNRYGNDFNMNGNDINNVNGISTGSLGVYNSAEVAYNIITGSDSGFKFQPAGSYYAYGIDCLNLTAFRNRGAADAPGTEVLKIDGKSANNLGEVVVNQDDVLDGTTYKQYSATEKTKLSGIAIGATANQTDSFLLSRSNHTGTQAFSTIIGTVPISQGGTGLTSIGSALQQIRVNAGATALEYFTPSAGGVTSISVASANGFAGSSSGGGTPAITVSTTVTGIVKGNGTSLTAAVAGTDYVTPSGNAATATALQNSRTIGTITGDGTSAGSSFDGTANNSNALTLATVNSNIGSFGTASNVSQITVNGKGLTTATANVPIQIAESQVTNLVSDLASKGSGTVTSVSGTANRVTVATGTSTPVIDISATFEALLGKVANRVDQNNAATTSAQLATVISDETGSGKVVYDTNPTMTGATINLAGTASLTFTGGSTANIVLGTGGQQNGSTFTQTRTIGTNAVSSSGLVATSTTFNDAVWQLQNQIGGYAAKTTTYTAVLSDYFIDCTTGTFTVTLPTAVGVANKRYCIKNSGTGVITIATTSSQTIDGVTTKTLNVQYGNFQIISDGANWKIISSM